jgi:RHS repeat-associated protein
VLDDAGAPLLTQTFDPYGNLLARGGAGESSFGFTGEQTDDNGLVYLRARYYQPGMGRFSQRDVWKGKHGRPQSLNPYTYAEGNPLLYVDPMGTYRQGSAGGPIWGTLEHTEIEDWYMNRYQNPFIAHLEFTIPNWGGLRPDMVNSLTGEIFDIKPVTLPTDAVAEAILHSVAMNHQRRLGNLSGPIVWQGISPSYYDWNHVPLWYPGFNFPLRQIIAVRGNLALYAGLVAPGAVVYWYEPRPIHVPAWVSVLVPGRIPQRWQRQPGWQPQPVPVPAFQPPQLTSGEIGTILIVAGATVIVATIAEDACTAGLGILDDPATFALGAYIIEVGSEAIRQGSLVPTYAPAFAY